MFNLLPEKEKIVLRKEYNRRRLIVWLGALCLLGISAVISLIPSFAFLYGKNSSATRQEIAVSKAYSDGVATYVKQIDLGRQLIALFGKDFYATSSVGLMRAITAERVKGVHITSFGFLYGEAVAIQIQGISETRESLREFVSRLNQTGLFERIEVPIASFKQESDIPIDIRTNIVQKP